MSQLFGGIVFHCDEHIILQDEVESEKLLAELRKSVNGVISDGRKKRSFAEVSVVCDTVPPKCNTASKAFAHTRIITN